jgi:hypothetical protein
MKKEIKEVVGVPAGILKSAENLFDNIVTVLEDTNDEDFEFKGTFTDNLSLPITVTINDLTITSVNVAVTFNVGEYSKLEIAGAGYSSELGLDYKKLKLVTIFDPSEIGLTMDFLIPNTGEYIFNDIITYMLKNRTLITSTLAHELKHAYDNYKQPNRKVTDQVDYNTNISSKGLAIPAFRRFNRMLYLATFIEQLVKPTELASRLKAENVSQKEFLEFLLNDRTYKEFIQLKKYSINTLVSELMAHEDELKSLDRFKGKATEEIINDLINLAYTQFTNDKIETLEKYILRDNDYSLKSLGMTSVNMDYFLKQVDKYQKYSKNPKDFFNNEIKFLNFVGDKMIKKLGKLYSIANEDKTQQANIIKKIYNKVNHGKG